MIRVQDLEVLFNTSTKLHNQLNTTPNSVDSAELLTWLGELEETSNIIENLIVDFDRTNFEYKYHELSEVYLTADRLINSATFSLNKDFTNFYEFAVNFYTSIRELLAKANILANREKFESNRDNKIAQEQLERTFSELKKIADETKQQIEDHWQKYEKRFQSAIDRVSDLSRTNSADIISYIRDVKRELAQLESESLNRIQVASQSAEKNLEFGTRQLQQIKESLEGISEHELKNVRGSINEIQRKALENIRTESSDISSVFQDQLSTTIDSFDKHYNSKIGVINKRIDEEVKAFELKRSDMDALLEKVGIAQDADVTITQANRELRSATWLRWTGLSFMCGSIALLIYFFRYYVGLSDAPQGVELPPLKELGFEFFALRFMTVILVSSPAIYLLKESASHRAKENLYRQRGTQLLTIQGYLADLSPEQRSEVKHKLAENFFKFHNGKADTSNVPDFIKNMNEAIKLAHAIKMPPASAPEKKDQTTTA